MSKEHKGQKGGDPSRIPPLIDVKWACETCDKVTVAQTRRPKAYTAPRFCGATCEDLQFEDEARAIVLARLGRELPVAELISAGVFRSIVKYGVLLNLAETKPSDVVVAHAVCPQCGQRASHYRSVFELPRQGNQFCTASCAQSHRAKLPAGVSCRSAFKKRFATEQEAHEAATLANAELNQHGENAMNAYLCTCNQFHFGHLTKAIAEQQAMSARDDLKGLFKDLLPMS